MNNVNKENIKFISKPLSIGKVGIAMQKSKGCKVVPDINAMKKSADCLID